MGKILIKDMENRGKRAKFKKYRLPRKLKKRLRGIVKTKSMSYIDIDKMIEGNPDFLDQLVEIGMGYPSKKMLKYLIDIETGSKIPSFQIS